LAGAGEWREEREREELGELLFDEQFMGVQDISEEEQLLDVDEEEEEELVEL
jgi:hypothetical protein